MLATERSLDIRERFGARVRRPVPVELDGETLRLILYLEDGTNLRVTEQNELKVGWDNVPHHMQLDNFPHHKYVGRQDNLHPPYETCLEEVMEVILAA